MCCDHQPPKKPFIFHNGEEEVTYGRDELTHREARILNKMLMGLFQDFMEIIKKTGYQPFRCQPPMWIPDNSNKRRR
jgi:hypothetical protein